MQQHNSTQTNTHTYTTNLFPDKTDPPGPAKTTSNQATMGGQMWGSSPPSFCVQLLGIFVFGRNGYFGH